MKYECSKNKKVVKKIVLYYIIHLFLVSSYFLLILVVIGLVFLRLCGLGMRPPFTLLTNMVLIFIVIALMVLDKDIKELKMKYTEDYITEYGDDVTSKDWFIKDTKFKKQLQITVTGVLAIALLFYFVKPVIENVYRNKVWCKINYTGPLYIVCVGENLSDYNEMIIDRGNAISLIEKYGIDLQQDCNAEMILKDDSEKYALIYYGEENSDNFDIEVYDVLEEKNEVSIIVGKVIPVFGNTMGTIQKVCFIPVSSNIDTVECEWRWHYR